MARIDPATGKVLEGPASVWSGSGLQHPEAPHLYRVGEWWYLLLAEGGTAHGHSVSIARARSPRGPYEPAPANLLLSHAGADRPIQCTGHADLVEAADGSWWAVLLGTRPRGWFPEFHVLGRETFLAPVEWVDGWPRLGPVRERHPAPRGAWHPRPAEPERDDFDAPALVPYWISPRRRPEGSWSLDARPGQLTLTAAGGSLDRPGHTFVGRRQQYPDCRTAVRPAPGSGRAGLSVRLDEAHHYDVEVSGGTVGASVRIGPVRQWVVRRPAPPGPLTLVAETRTSDVLPPTVTAVGQQVPGVRAAGPDTIGFSVETTEGRLSLAEVDGRYLSTQVAGGFTGRVIGMYVTEGAAAFDWFEHRPSG